MSANGTTNGSVLNCGKSDPSVRLSDCPLIDPDAQLSFGQQRLWLMDRLEPDRPLYNIPYLIRLRGRLDLTAIQSALTAIVQRHESLRTTIAVVDGDGRPRIASVTSIELPLSDLGNLADAPREEELMRLASAEARRPFDLGRDLMLRARMFRLGDSDHALLVILHHIAADGWSLSILYRELGAYYASFSAGQPAPFGELPAQYPDFAGWQREYLSGGVLEELLGFWKKNLAGAPALLDLPGDRARPPVLTFKGAMATRRLPQGLGKAARELARQRQVTLFMTLLAAFKALLHRYTNRDDLVVGTFVAGRSQPETEAMIGFFVNTLVLRTDVAGDPTFAELVDRVRAVALGAYDHQELPFEKLVEELQPGRNLSHGPVCQVIFTLQNMPSSPLRMPGMDVGITPVYTGTSKFDLSVWVEDKPDGLELLAEYSTDLFDAETIQRLLGHYETILQGAVNNPQERISRLPLLTPEELHCRLNTWNGPECDYPRDRCIHELFEAQVRSTPQAVAAVFEDRQLTYQELDARADELAVTLRALGVGPDVLVGICVERSLEMLVGLLGILKSGGAYVPLDPAYPAARIAFMLEDSNAPVVLTQSRLRSRLPATGATVICLDEPERQTSENRSRSRSSFSFSNNSEATGGNEGNGVENENENEERGTGTERGGRPGPENLAYVIYTSGSTGRPKGVMLTHRGVVNFFAGMDRVLGREPGVWLAVTSISFDISVLELFWTLARGFKVVILSDEARIGAAGAAAPRTAPVRPLDFSLLYFADAEGRNPGDKYRMLLEGAAFADRNGFRAVWTPERHFHSFGGLYPNPAVTSAALAQITQRIQIRAGSVVAPLHHPLRIAEEWAVVDHLSKGRVGVSFASGWHDRDFTLAPDNFADRSQLMLRNIDLVRRLWRGEQVEFPGVGGRPSTVRIYPQPVQAELPVWLTAAGNPKTFEAAGRMGAGVLTHLLGQTVDELAEKIRLYRAARREAGHDAGCVSLAVHAFVGEDDADVRARVRGPFCQYLLRSLDLMQGLTNNYYPGVNLKELAAEERDLLMQHAFDHHFGQSALLGSAERCRPLLDRLAEIGVDEVACLIDFGMDADAVLAGLPHLARLQDERKTAAAVPVSGFSFAEQMARHGVTHLQCTPSHARLLAQVPDALRALRPLRKLLLGGEALPAALAQQLGETVPGGIVNMYGPTETTVWSAAHPVPSDAGAGGTVSIGRPIANTQVYLVDSRLQHVPTGVPGELLIGGDGLARGYLNRAELTAERFIESPFRPGARLYRTGDLARFRPGGLIEFLGRIDHQVKIRGHRIELGEIESALGRHASVAACVAVVREDVPGDPRLIAYVVAAPGAATEPDALRDFIKRDLPEYMVPSAFVMLEQLPLTPNGKVDRNALPAPVLTSTATAASVSAPPQTELEKSIAAIWCRRLGLEAIGRHDNFFELGGHSLLVVQVQAQLLADLGVNLPLVKLFQYPTVTALAAHLADGMHGRASSGKIQERAKRQRAALLARSNGQPEAVA